MPLSPDAVESAARSLVGRLKTARERLAAQPQADLRKELASEMRAGLAGLAPADAERAAAAARDLLAEEARQRTSGGESGASTERVRQLETRLADAEARAAKLEKENARLRADVASRPAAPAGDRLGSVRQALQALAGAPESRQDAASLPAEDLALVAGVGELLKFAVDMKASVGMLLQDMRIGPAANMNSLMFDSATRGVQDQFALCVRGEQGSAEALRALLSGCRSDVIDLNEAYGDAIPRGVAALLSELDPQPLAASKRGVLGTDEKQAWNAYVRLHGDMTGLSHAEIWERFFQPQLTRHLAGKQRIPKEQVLGRTPPAAPTQPSGRLRRR